MQSKAEKLWGFDPLKPREKKMKYASVYFQTRHGRAGCVISAHTCEKLEQSLDSIPRAHNNHGLGLIGYMGHDTFDEAINDASAWEHWTPKQ